MVSRHDADLERTRVGDDAVHQNLDPARGGGEVGGQDEYSQQLRLLMQQVEPASSDWSAVTCTNL